jgi:N-formylglutamate amidohydrolase
LKELRLLTPAAQETTVLPPGADGSSDKSFDVCSPAQQTAPVVFASPHSGQCYPALFVAESRLSPVALRRSEDAFIDEVYGAAPEFGCPLLRAHFPRAYIDANREPFELDQNMFADDLPDYVNAHSPRVEAGLGTIARVVTNGEEIYRRKLKFSDAIQRIDRYYKPYHDRLQRLLEDTLSLFGNALLIDCHSMPSIGGPMDSDEGAKRVDMILGDRHGTSCTTFITDMADDILQSMGYCVTRNQPYAGGFTTAHYGQPRNGVHALQIEINRALYMDEVAILKADGFTKLSADIAKLIEATAEIGRKRMVAL